MTKTYTGLIPYKDGVLVVDKEATNIKEGFVVMQAVWGKSIEPKLLAVIGIDKKEYVIKAKKVEGDLNHADINGETYATVLISDCSSKIIASTVRIEGVPLIQMPDELKEKLYTIIAGDWAKHEDDYPYINQTVEKCYKAASRGYSEEEVKTLIQSVLEFMSHHEPEEFDDWFEKKLKKFKSLQPKIKSIELEYETCEYCGGDGIYIDGDNNRLDCNVHAIHIENKLKIHDKVNNIIHPVKVEYFEN